MSKVKVWRVGTKREGWRVVAAFNQRDAAKLLRVAVQTLRWYGGATDDPDAVAAAMSEPGAVFYTIGERHRLSGRDVANAFHREP